MNSTYINETYDIAYPLFGTGKLPFPNSVLTSLSICLIGSHTSTPMAVTHMVLSESTIHIVVGRGTTTIGTFTIDPGTRNTSADLEPAFGINAIGHVTTGIIPESAYGRYNGSFLLDPSCVLYMPESVYSKYTAITANGNSEPVGPYIRLRAGGFCSLDNNMLTGESDPMTAGHKYNMVEAINGMRFEETDNGSSLLFISTDPAVVALEAVQVKSDSNHILLLVNGTKSFPNCYSSSSDQAITAQE